ncbi:hypothetical protein [Membranihabitans marinus]|uniref:hypothetical protein n=1 Tax=Membranihabitans marinus TaxID=1227546 RepID=UPI001F383D9B|nr:hypothetical protein [Membranihabitans marinus]
MELVIFRKPDWFDIASKYTVSVDGKRKGILSFSKPLKLNLEEDSQKLSFKFDWLTSNDIDLKSYLDRGKINVRLGLNPMFSISTTVCFVGLLLWYLTDFMWFKFVIFPPFIIVFYYLTLGRNNFFDVKIFE